MFFLDLISRTKYAGIIFFIALAELVNSSSITRQIQCYNNYNNILRRNISLTDKISTIKLTKNSINTFFLSFPNRSEAIKKLFLNANNITEVLPEVFRNFPNLEVLDLTDNNLNELHADVFLGNQHLREIYLDGNNFEILKWEAFRNLAKLERVTLKENHLGSCKLQTLRTLYEFKKRGIITDVPDLCNYFDESVDETNLSPIKTTKSETFTDRWRNNKFPSDNLLIIAIFSVGIVGVNCLMRRRRNTSGEISSTESGNLEESGYLVPTPSKDFPICLEVSPDVGISTKSDKFKNAVLARPHKYKLIVPHRIIMKNLRNAKKTIMETLEKTNSKNEF